MPMRKAPRPSKVLAALLAMLVGIACSQPVIAAPLQVQVIRLSEGSLVVNSTLIKGEKKAVLIDVPFTIADAHRAVAEIKDSGRDLETVFITHDHPDHFFSMEVIKQAYPNAKIVADPRVVADIWRSLPFKVKRWGPMLGDNGPRFPTAPAPLDGHQIMLEGQELQILGPMGGDHPHSTAVWIPSIKALVTGDLVFNQVYLWLGEHKAEDIAAWSKSLQTLKNLGPELIVPGHSKPGTKNDLSALNFSVEYLQEWPKLVAASRDSADLIKRVKARFPESVDVLGDFILGTSARVAKGEEPLWQE